MHIPEGPKACGTIPCFPASKSLGHKWMLKGAEEFQNSVWNEWCKTASYPATRMRNGTIRRTPRKTHMKVEYSGGGEAWGGVACGWCVVQRRDLVIWFCPPEQNWRSSKSQKSQKLPTKGFPPVWVTTTPNRKPGFAYGWNFNTGGGGLLNWVGESNLFGGLHKPSVLSSCRQIQIQGWVRVRVREVVFSAFVPM